MRRRVGCVVSGRLGGGVPNQLYATLGIRAGSVTLVHPCREDLSIDRRVHGNRTLYAEADPTTTNYILILVGSEFSSSRGCRGRKLGGIVNYELQLIIIQCCSNFCCIVTFISVDINCWLILTS